MKDRIKKAKNYHIKKREEGLLKLIKLNRKKIKKKSPSHQVEDIIMENRYHLLALLKNRKFNNDFFDRKKETIDIPEDFCMSTNPDGVINCIKKIFTGIINNKVKTLHFDHTKCKKIDLAASSVMDAIIISTKSKVDIKYSGEYDTNSKIGAFLNCSGILNHLGVCQTYNENKDIKNERSIEYELVEGSEKTKSDELTTNLTEFYNNCLKTQGFQLNNNGLRAFYNIIGEVISNCKDHGHNESKWYVQGHYYLNENNIGEFYLTIFNFGYSIYEVLKKQKLTTETKNKLEEITKKHRTNFSQSWNKEMLWTLYCLQEGISRLKDSGSAKNYSRGTGTMTFINAFYLIGGAIKGKNPIMSITSGKTHIVFDDKYKIAKKNDNQIIAFNKENDLDLPPDKDNVKRLKYHFPGTIINIDMPLERDYLINFKRGEKPHV